jgi:hypothetical protein
MIHEQVITESFKSISHRIPRTIKIHKIEHLLYQQNTH